MDAIKFIIKVLWQEWRDNNDTKSQDYQDGYLAAIHKVIDLSIQ